MSRPHLARRAACAVVAVSAALPALAVVATAAGARVSGTLAIESRWRALEGATNVQGSRFVLDTAGRTAFAFYTTPGGMSVRAFDLDSYRARTAPLAVPGAPALRPSTPIVVDEAHGVAVVAPDPAGAAAPAVTPYAVRGRAITAAGSPATRFPAGYAVLGLAVDAARGRMLALGAPSGGGFVKTAGAGVGNVMLDSWRLGDLAAGRITSEWTTPLRVPPTCGQAMTTTFQAAIMPSPDGKRVYFGCLSNRGFATPLGPNAGDVGGVAELDVALAATGATSALRLRPIAGDFSQGDSFAVPRKQRLALVAGSSASTTVKVYDVAHRAYVGNVGASDSMSAVGFDTATARAYYINGSGLGSFDAALTPVDQGVVDEDLTTVLGALQRTVEVDPKTKRVFVVSADDVVNGPDPYVMVLRDGRPYDHDVPPVVESLDVAEQPGRYESSRTADAAALGADLRMVGGPNNLIFNTTHFDSRGILTRPGTRWLQLGATNTARLTGDEASAEVSTTRYDDASAADAGNTKLAAPVLCADFGFSATSVTQPDAAVTCDVRKSLVAADVAAEPGRVLATYGGHADLVPAPVRVKVADSAVESHREPDGTLVTTLRAEANGVDILGAVQVGRVVATATLRTHGRPGTAKATYERSVTGLVVNGVEVCAAECPFEQVSAAVAETFGGRVAVDFPAPAIEEAANGAAASVTDNAYRHVERATFDDVPNDSTLAPAMEVVVYLDGTTASRLIAGLAGVSGRQRYRIFSLGADLPGPPAPRPSASAGPLPPPAAPRDGDTGGPVIEDPAGPVPTTVAQPPATPGELVQRLREGLKVVFRSPRQLAAVAALWALLALPAYLAARRRLLLDLPFLRRAIEESP